MPFNFQQVIIEGRQRTHKTLSEVQKDTGISAATICRWERGHVVPSMSGFELLCRYYGIEFVFRVPAFGVVASGAV